MLVGEALKWMKKYGILGIPQCKTDQKTTLELNLCAGLWRRRVEAKKAVSSRIVPRDAYAMSFSYGIRLALLRPIQHFQWGFLATSRPTQYWHCFRRQTSIQAIQWTQLVTALLRASKWCVGVAVHHICPSRKSRSLGYIESFPAEILGRWRLENWESALFLELRHHVTFVFFITRNLNGLRATNSPSYQEFEAAPWASRGVRLLDLALKLK